MKNGFNVARAETNLTNLRRIYLKFFLNLNIIQWKLFNLYIIEIVKMLISSPTNCKNEKKKKKSAKNILLQVLHSAMSNII